MTDQRLTRDRQRELVRQRLVEMVKQRLSCLPLMTLVNVAFEADVISVSEMHMILIDGVLPESDNGETP